MHYKGFSCELLVFLLCPCFSFGAALHAIHCAPCTEEQLISCPLVPASCPETALQPGCGCCHTCALQLGEPCGVYTARCRQGLSCRVRPEETRPLYVLTHGQGTCLPTIDITETAEYNELQDVPTDGTEMTAHQRLSYQQFFPLGQEKSAAQNVISAYESMKAKIPAEIRKEKEQSPCRKELYRALEKLKKAQRRTRGEIYRFYLPNCQRNGFYHSKQCENAFDGNPARCWCVYPKNGKRIPGSPEMIGNPECEQYLRSQE